MAKKTIENPTSKSEHIRDYLSKHRKATASVIVPALAEQGIEVTPQLVSSVKSSMKSRGKKKRRRTEKVATQQTAARKTPADSLTAADLVAVKELADSLGGVDQLRRALDVLDELVTNSDRSSHVEDIYP